MAIFKSLHFDIEDGIYSGVIRGYRLTNNQERLQLDIEVDGEDFLLRPASMSLNLSENHVLLRYFKEFGYTLDTINEICIKDLIGEKILFAIRHHCGRKHIFCNLDAISRSKEPKKGE